MATELPEGMNMDDDPALHSGGQHGPDCGCALPPEVAFTVTWLRDGRVVMGRRIRRAPAAFALRKIADTLDLADACDEVETDMKDRG